MKAMESELVISCRKVFCTLLKEEPGHQSSLKTFDLQPALPARCTESMVVQNLEGQPMSALT